MRILLVNPITRNLLLSSPDLGLGYIASALRKAGHEVFLLDCVNQGLTYEKFDNAIAHLNIDVFGFKIFSSNLSPAKKSLEIARKRHPAALIVLGGAHPSAHPQQTLDYFGEADFAFRGEAEIGMVDLINNLSGLDCIKKSKIPGLIWRNGNKNIVNPPIFSDNLDSLGIPAWDLIDPRNYPFQTHFFTKSKIVAPILMTRGCSSRCTFCSCRSVTGSTIRGHSVAYIIEEIKFLKSNFGVREVCFIDDNFLALKGLVEETCKQLIEQKIDVCWSCFGIRIDLIDKDILRLMEKAGCYLFSVGIESGSQRILNHMKKGISLELIKEKTTLVTSSSHIKIIGNFIFGYPAENEDDVRKTIKFARTLPLYSANFYPFFPSPGTEIYKELIDRKEIDEAFLTYDVYNEARGIYLPKNISAQKFSLLMFWGFISFYLRPRILLNFLKATRTQVRLKYIFSALFVLLIYQIKYYALAIRSRVRPIFKKLGWRCYF